MKKALLIFLLLFSIDSKSFSQENDISGLVWNKWDTENFIILSLDYNQGVYLKNNIENIKKSIFEKWNLKNVKFSSDCKILCVNNKSLLKKLFKIDEPKAEIRYDKDGKIYLTALWFFMDDKKDFPKDKLAEICLSYLEKSVDKQMPLYLKKGMSSLSGNLDNIKQNLNDNILEIDTNKLFSVTLESFDKLSVAEKIKFINQSSSLVLLFRKEYGRDNFNNFLNKNQLSSFGIKDNNELNKIITRYNKYLIKDLMEKKVPDTYLEITK